ncbi:MAG: hypothetical protein M0P31_18865, partial [Solirubrobacteraceae bacterium]|nr:hypothetical protein [Solirubrobacteraceae bacterium]
MASSRSDRPTSAPTTGARTGDGPPAGGTRPGRSPDRTTGDRIDPTDAALRAIAVEAGVDDPARLDRRDTHLSIVLLTPDRAYKVKRARRLAFADHTDPAVRRGACETEIAVNRDLAPDVYLGVRSVVPDGDGFRLGDGDDPAAVEHVVEMARF